ncbi:MAG: hypothetical protein OEY18_07665 [Candidatus Aminicenantes bacterium]|nr:hypothetical protein [Candidatus Aminicenantes bacterium]MDH5384566.1 hypothetical protein [Candidatus Aminicenantes bacterium]
MKIIKSATVHEVSGERASSGRVFLILETEWENIHPKQKVEKDKLEGKTDRTMGVSTLAGKKKKETEYVEVDVAYMVEKLFDHAYLIADGLAYPLHEITESVPEGVVLRESFTIAKQGEKRKAVFVYSIPESAENLGFQFFDYQYGHVLLPVQGDLKAARGSGKAPGKVLDQIQTKMVEIAAHSVDFQNTYAEEEAPEDWEYGVVQLSGKSLSGKNVKDIVQIEPTEYTWVHTEGGYLYYASGGSTTEEGMIRFTPEIFQHQELAFLIPKSDQVIQLGIRLRNDVFQLNLTDAKPKARPKAIATHRDGDVMEVMVFGMHEEDGKVIMDLGIQSLATSGIEIQRDAQFMLVVNEEKISLDNSFTDDLLHRPPSPFIIPPKTFIRFKLAYETEGTPTDFYFRGYESEATLNLSDKK